MIRIFSVGIILCMMLITGTSCSQTKAVLFCGSENNDLYRLLSAEGFDIRRYDSPEAAIKEARKGAPVFVVSDSYPEVSTQHPFTAAMLQTAKSKQLKLYIEYPASFPGLSITQKPVATQLERGVVTSTVFGEQLKPMSLLGINDCHILPVTVKDPLIVLAKVVGFDKAVYGLDSTPSYPLLFENGPAFIAMTKLSHFTTARYGPKASIERVWTYILSRMTGQPSLRIRNWPMDVAPSYGRDEKLPADVRRTSVKKGVDWFYNAKLFVHPAWKEQWAKYMGDGNASIYSPPVADDMPVGDGTLGIVEGHKSKIMLNGDQQYNYWMRADVQGEVSMALAAAAQYLHHPAYNEQARNIIDFTFKTSNMRAGAKNDPGSAVFGLIGWATSHPGVFYGDDNARVILGAIGASAFMGTDKWDKQLVEAILGNFRTTGKQGFRGERLEESDILKNGWKHYWDREIVHISPHFESWMWALYLWLYSKTGYEPLLERTKTALKLTMEAYPAKWEWGSSMQTQRARLILPLAWLVRVADTEEHRRWLDIMVDEILKYQVPSGAIREEIGTGAGRFKPQRSNKDYGIDESSLIYQNGDPVAGMLYTCNFAIFSLNEAAHATHNKKYEAARDKLADFLLRIQVKSAKHKDLDGAWFRGFEYNRWDYWASNSDAGWGVWCTLSGWSQSWIVTSQVLIGQHQSYWDLTQRSNVNRYMKETVNLMFGDKKTASTK